MNLHSFISSIALLASASAIAIAQEAPPRPGAARTPSEEIKLLPPEEVAKLPPKPGQQADGKRLPQPDNPLDPNRPAKSDKEPAKIKPAENAATPAENAKKVLSKEERKAKAAAKDAPGKDGKAVKDAKDAKAPKEPAKIRPAENAAVPAENTDKVKDKPAKDKESRDKQASQQPARRAVPMVVDGMASVQPPSYGPKLTARPVAPAGVAVTSTTSATATAPLRPSGPAIVNSCDGGGCTDTNGVRYNGTPGGTMIGPGGKACHHNGVTMQC